jgi:hypothetical protein
LHSLLEVDDARIGLHGASYGGWLAAVAAGYDDRFAFAVPIYGSLAQQGAPGRFGAMFYANCPRSAALWDATEPLKNSRTPIFFINGANDAYFSPSGTSACAAAAPLGSLYLKPDLAHTYTFYTELPEIYAFADSICKGGAGLPHISLQPERDDPYVEFENAPAAPVVSATLYWTDEARPAPDTVWRPVALAPGDGYVDCNGKLPTAAKAAYIGLTDSRMITVSTRLIFPEGL